MQLGLEWGIPESVRREGAEAARRARLVAVACAITGAISGYIAAVQLAIGSRLVGLVGLALTAAAATGFVLIYRTGAWRSVGATLCAGIFLGAAIANAGSGGELAAASFYLCLVPLLVTLLFGTRPGAATAIACAVFLTAVEWMRRGGADFPLHLDADLLAESRYRGAMLFQFILLAIAVVYDRLRTASLEDVRESDARYRALGAGSTDLVFELDAHGLVRFVSEEHAAALGWTAHQLTGEPAVRFVHESETRAVPKRIREVLGGGRVQAENVLLRTAEGEYRCFEVSLTSFKAPAGPRIIVIARDLTDRLRMEEQLRQSQKMDAVGQLASGVAHDFNNLLMVMASYAEILTDELPEGEARTAARQILRAADQGEALTRQLVAVSRPSSSTPEATQLNELVRELERILSLVVGETIELSLDLDPDLPPILASASHLEQVLVNLAVNARDAMPDGGRLRIASRREGDDVVLRVRDTGAGMDEETRLRAFEAFYTTKQRQSGTGLGLYVVYSIVAEMDGTIEIDSALEKGTCFTLRFPAREDAVPAGARAAERGAAVSGGGATVLVVEDRTELRDLIRTTLDSAGYHVMTAGDGKEALDLAGRHRGPIDLVLSDVVMPNMSGPDMARALHEERPDARFVFMSGHPERARELADSLSEGALLTKPIVPSELRRHVQAALRSAGPAGSKQLEGSTPTR